MNYKMFGIKYKLPSTVENTRGILDIAIAFKKFKILCRSRVFSAKKIACARL